MSSNRTVSRPTSNRVRLVVASSVMLTFISFWRAAAIVLNDLGSSAFYAGGIAEDARPRFHSYVVEHKHPSYRYQNEVRVGDLGSGSDFTPFLQHAGVPSTDIGSGGPYGVYHSVFDNYNWFIKNADPTFVYEQEMARVFGLSAFSSCVTSISSVGRATSTNTGTMRF